MKARIIGTLLVIAVLGALYVLIEGSGNSAAPAAQNQVAPHNPSDDAFKGLKIN